jgi:acyl-coenzyme A thioesterase PaaI-like protein
MTCSSDNREADFPQFPDCFVCGSDNPKGLRMSFRKDGDGVVAPFTPDAMHCGFSGIVHGGIIASLLDEALVWACWIRTGRFGVTGKFSIRYLESLPAGTLCLVRGRLVQDRRKLWDVESWLEGATGEVFARAEGVMVPLKDSEQSQHKRK